MYDYIGSEIQSGLRILGIPKLREPQREPLNAILRGIDTFVSMPTGGGKSLLFQLPAIVDGAETLTIVISPLLALQRDQVESLAKKGVSARLLNSELGRKKRQKVLESLNKLQLLYLTPEQLRSQDVIAALCSQKHLRVVVDEAHILAQAQYEFRPAYGEIADFMKLLPERPQIIALTATATPKDRRVILESLEMENAKEFLFPVRRPNLKLYVKKIESGGKSCTGSVQTRLWHAVEQMLDKFLEKGDGGAAIVYVPTVKGVKKLHRWLKARNWSVAKFTGPSNKKKKAKAQKAFMSGRCPIMIATNAFGLGINKPDVRLIVHAGLPLTMDGYVQEIGRAGRDGKKSNCVLIYTDGDVERNKRILCQSSNGEVIRMNLNRLYALQKFVKKDKCLWRQIEKYFGQKQDHACGTCCRCKKKSALTLP